MFYEPDKNDHGLPFNPFKSICVPRPIGWVSTLSKNGIVNLAPYSQYQNLAYDPPYVMFSGGGGGGKDSVRNATDTGEFVINMATWELRNEINTTSQSVPPDVDEAELAGLEMLPSRIVKAPRVARSPVHMECRLQTVVALPGRTPEQVHYVVMGRVVGVHIRDDVLTSDGRLDVLKIRPLARMGYHDYTSVTEVFTMKPTGPGLEERMAGLEGRPVFKK
jgi:flavin reductase (DIM6/NTAB) family NADH-FMN oxidoreductase RutF